MERDQLEDSGIDDGILNGVLKEWHEMKWTGFTWLRLGTVMGFCEYGNKPPSSVKCRKCFQYLR